MPGKVIFVVSNDVRPLGEKRVKTGSYLPIVANMYKVFMDAGFKVTFVSPKGGKATLDEGGNQAYKDDPLCKDFLTNHLSKLDVTMAPSNVNPGEYVGMIYIGGHGPMFDVSDNTEIAELARVIYEQQNGILGACCHGTVGFVPIKLTSGEPLVKGHTLTSFTNSEEEEMKLVDALPFLLESKLVSLGAIFKGSGDWECNVQVSGRLVTGQNPQSAKQCGEKIVDLMAKSKK